MGRRPWLPFLIVLAVVEASLALPWPSSPSRGLAPRQVQISSFSTAIPISANTLNLVKARANDGSKASWELGTMAEALLEIDWPWLSVFGDQGVPPPRDATGTNNISSVLAVADYALSMTPAQAQQLFQDIEGTAAGDPPAIGVATLIANYTKASRPQASAQNYDNAVRVQLNYILNVVPKTSDGAISHRSEQVQLWSDFTYMVPPFMAYYAALYQPSVNTWLLWQSYWQIRLYRQYLYDSERGLWRHITLGYTSDVGAWTTGNGWAAMGMLRVLATINQTTVGYQPEFQAAQIDLQNWATEIVNNIWKYQQANGTLLNYPDDPYSFADSSGTALLAAATYRIACINVYLRGPSASATSAPPSTTTSTTTTLPAITTLSSDALTAAHRARDLIRNSIDPGTGWLQNVVNPWSYAERGSENSPEGQSFILMMESAWRVWIDNVS